MKKLYITPNSEVITLFARDVLTLSFNQNNSEGNDISVVVFNENDFRVV